MAGLIGSGGQFYNTEKEQVVARAPQYIFGGRLIRRQMPVDYFGSERGASLLRVAPFGGVAGPEIEEN